MTDEKKKPMNLGQLRQALAVAAGITNNQAKLALEALSVIAIAQTNECGVFNVPGVCKVLKIHKPAKPERKMISPFNKQEITVKAKPASNRLKIRPIKSFKDSIQ
jgi:hypothetical protein